MRGLFVCLIVIVTVTAVRSQGPATKTKKGTRPARRNDNPDVGLPSGADVPDGRRFVGAPPRAATKPAVRPATRPAARPTANLVVKPAVNPARPPTATKTRAGPPPQRRRNDNPDFGLPSGRDFPNAGMGRPASAPAVRPAARSAPMTAAARAAPMPAPARQAPVPVAARPVPMPAAARPAPMPAAARPAPMPAAARPAPMSAAARPAPMSAAAGPAPIPAVSGPASMLAAASRPMATVIKSGPPPPGRRNDNPDFGLPSGRDFPDAGMGLPASAPAPVPAVVPAAGPPATMIRSGPPPPGRRPAANPAPAPMPAAMPVAAPPATMTRSGPPPLGRLNDNPDFGLPSGQDFPDAGMAPVPKPTPFSPPVVPGVPARAAAALECAYYCPTDYLPVCTMGGNEYDNDCYRQCSGEVLDCDSPCPCNVEPTPPPVDPMVPAWDDCTYRCPANNDPVCVEGEEFKNECFARCSGHDQFTCSSSCPC